MNLEASDLSLSAVKDLVCSIVDQKVRVFSLFLLLPAEQPVEGVSNTCMHTTH